MARREVAVDLILRASQYLREGRAVLATTIATTRAVDDLGDKADATTRDMVELAAGTELAKHQVDDLGDKAKSTAAAMTLLQSRISASRAAVRGLAMDFAATGEGAGALSKEQGELRRLERAARILAPEPGLNVFAAVPRIGGVPGPLIAGGAAATAALAPFLGGVIAAAVLGSVGTGGLIGGIALASQDTRVRSAFKEFGKSMFTELSDATVPLVGPLVDAADMFGKAWKAELPGMQADFKILAQTVEPISEGLAGFIHQLHPGLSAALKASLPIAKQFGDEFERFGGATSDFLESMADSAPGAKVALHDLFTVTDEGLRQLGQGVEILSTTYEGLRKLGLVAPPEWLLQAQKGLLPAWLDVMGQARESFAVATGGVEVYHRSLTGGAAAADKLNRELEEQAEKAKRATDKIKDLERAINDAADAYLAALDAPERWEAAIDSLTESVARNGRTLDIHTEQGRANRDAVEEMVRATLDMRDAGLLTDAAYQAQIQSIITMGVRLGLSRAEVEKIVASFKTMPSQIAVNFVLSGTPGLKNAFALLKSLAGTAVAATPTAPTPSHQQFLGFQGGGKTPAFEPFRVHAGETLWSSREHYVATATQTRAIDGGAGGPVEITLRLLPSGDAAVDALISRISAEVTHRGGSPQTLGITK